MGRLHGKIAIITGAGSGIGRAAAEIFAEEGATVVAADRNVADAEETIARIKAQGRNGAAIGVDVTRASDVKAMVTTALKWFGRIDVLYNHVGINRPGTVIDLEESDWDLVVTTNLKSVYLGCKYTLPHMIERGSGAIVNTGGTFGFYGGAAFSAYCAAKGGVINLTKQLALDYAPYGVRVNCVCPGFIDTPMNANVPADVVRAIVKTQPLGRPGRPEEVARAAVFLASDEASFTTGVALLVDGGQLSGRHGA